MCSLSWPRGDEALETLLTAVVGTALLIVVAFALGFRGEARIMSEEDVARALAAMPRTASPARTAIAAGGVHALALACDGRLVAVTAQGDTVSAREVRSDQIERDAGSVWVRGDLGHPDISFLAPAGALDAVLARVEATPS